MLEIEVCKPQLEAYSGALTLLGQWQIPRRKARPAAFDQSNLMD
jgi:hypothetical protein